MLATIGYIQWDEEDPASIGEMIVRKLRRS
jgi:hypothetical protein